MQAPAAAPVQLEGSRWLPWLVVLAALVAAIALPLLALLGASLEDGVGSLARGVASALPSVAATLWTSLAATALALAVGGSIAVAVVRSSLPGRRALRAAMLVALIVPGYVAAAGWLDAYAPGGLVDDLTGLAFPSLVGPLGIVAVLAAEATPIVYLIVSAAIAAHAEPDLERAARAAGATPWMAFRTITLPLLRPTLAGASVVAFVLSVTSFGVPLVLGVPAGFTTMTTRIYRDLAFSSEPESFVRAVGLALMLAVGAAVLVALGDALLGRRSIQRAGTPAGPRGVIGGAAAGPRHVRGGGDGMSIRHSASRRTGVCRMLGAAVAWGVVLVVIVVPLLGLAITALAKAPGLAPMPANWTLESFREVVSPHSIRALANSTILAAGAAFLVVGLGCALVATRQQPGGGAVGRLLGLTFALPGSTLAVAVLLAYGVALRDTLAIILVAYVAKFWALGYRPIAAGIDGMPEDLRRAARASGADAWTTTRTIVLPLIRPLVVAAGFLVFLFALHEVTISSLLHGPGTTTLGVVVLDLQQLGDVGRSAALAIILTLLVGIVSLPVMRVRGAIGRLGW
jgi:iron(III) transport system permease protein